VYGGFLAGHATLSVKPELLLSASFWQGWMGMVASVVVWPQSGLSGITILLIDAVLITLGLVSLRFVRDRTGNALLLGLWMGYVGFGLVFTHHISTHFYYSLPLVPIIALSLGPLGSAVVTRLRRARTPMPALAALLVGVVVLGAGWKVEPKFGNPDYEYQADRYKRIGALVEHTTEAVHVDPLFDMPLLYYGWIASYELYSPQGQRVAADDLNQRLRHVAARYGRPRFLIVTSVGELETQPALRAFIRRLPALASSREYAIFILDERATPP